MIATRKKDYDKPQEEREYSSRHPDPTHEEIRKACLEIQREWSEREFEKRAGVRPTPWSAPIVTLPEQEA
jgi:hypothetical protein